MKRGQGKRLKEGETKQNIIEFIASSPSLVVKETEIRDYLIEKHNTSETKNIKEKLKDLSEQDLITKEDNSRLGITNKWSIENVTQLQGIVKKYNDLTKILQRNDKIISMLIDQHFQTPFFFKESYEMWKTFDECEECLKFPQIPEGIDCNFNVDERKKCIEVANRYLFTWEKIPGDNGRLIEFLIQNFSIEWVNSAKIEKIDNDKTIKVSTEKNSLSLILNDGKTEVNLQIDDRTAGQFFAKTENGELNIYENYLYVDERITGKEKKMLSDDRRYMTARQISASHELANKVKNSAIDFENNKFKEYLRISPCFFKICLKTPAEFNKTFKKIFQLTMTKNPHNVELQNCFAIEAQKFKYYDKILEICVHTDIIFNEASEEAIEYVHNMKRNTEVVMPE